MWQLCNYDWNKTQGTGKLRKPENPCTLQACQIFSNSCWNPASRLQLFLPIISFTWSPILSHLQISSSLLWNQRYSEKDYLSKPFTSSFLSVCYFQMNLSIQSSWPVRILLLGLRCADRLTRAENLVEAYHRKLQAYHPILVALINYIAFARTVRIIQWVLSAWGLVHEQSQQNALQFLDLPSEQSLQSCGTQCVHLSRLWLHM